MRTTTRAWLIALGLMLGLACSVQAQGADIAKLFPDNTEMAFSFNIKSVLNSGIFQKHFKEEVDKKIKENAQLLKMLETVSLDPMKDITSVTFTVSKFIFKQPGSPPDIDMFGVIKGAFNVEKLNGALGALIAAANEGGKVTTSKFGDYVIYEVKDTSSGKTFYGLIYDKETIIGGNVKQDVTNAVERLAGRKTGTLNNKFSELMSKARNDNTMWGAIVIPSSVRDMAKMAPPNVSDVIGKFETQTINLNVKDNVKFDVTMYLQDDEAATAMKGLMDQAKDFAGAAALADENLGSELADLVSSLQIGSNGKKVSLAGDIKAELIDKIVKAMKDRSK